VVRLAFSLLVAGSTFGPAFGEAIRQPSSVSGLAIEVDVRDLAPEAAHSAAQTAVLAAETTFELLARDGASRPLGGLARLIASQGELRFEPATALRTTLERALDVCDWSSGAHGPFAADLRRLWGLTGAPAGIPPPEKLASALSGKECGRQLLRADLPALGLGALRSRLDLDPYAAGAAVDEAFGVLVAAGAKNARVRIGTTERAIGLGPAGLGWPVILPRPPGMNLPLSPIYLKDAAIAQALSTDRPFQIGGEVWPRFIDQRTGQPATGVLSVFVSTQNALDAQALAEALFILGAREGEYRLGNLRPKPAALWLLGGGGGEPLIVEVRWSGLKAR
jgi:thiamine biosynthesis lipoprotein